MGICSKKGRAHSAQAKQASLEAQLLDQQERDAKRKQRVMEITKHMRENIYQAQMKPFFEGGVYTYEQFCKKFFNEDIKIMQMRVQTDSEEERNRGKSFFQKYLMVHPQTSRFIATWETLMLLVILVEFLLIPYTVCLGIDKVWAVTMPIEYVVDGCWFVMILLCFCTCTERDGVYETRFKTIARQYLTTDFWHDFLSMVSLVAMPWHTMTYWSRVLRFFRLGTMKRFAKQFWYRVGVRLNFPKQKTQQIQYFCDFMIILLLSMHSLACCWVWLGCL